MYSLYNCFYTSTPYKLPPVRMPVSHGILDETLFGQDCPDIEGSTVIPICQYFSIHHFY